jgi:FkbM family methyltransferase
VPYVFERLQRNLGDDPRFALENAAVADRDGTLPFYHLDRAGPGDDVPPWYDGLGSFSRETILSHADKIPDIADRLVATEVPCLTFESLCRKHGVEQLDVLLIDAEGYDWEIVRRLDLEARHPRVLVYEHYHLPAPVRTQAREHLEARGYRTMEEGFDTWCLSTRARGRLAAVWDRLDPVDPPFSADEHPA